MTKGGRLNWANRQGPGEFDVTTPTTPDYSFDHRRSVVPGTPSWPEKFGPASITAAWKHGLVVIAEIQDLPHPVAITESHWTKGTKVLTVRTQGNWLVPDRLYTRASVKGLMSTGELIEGDDDH